MAENAHLPAPATARERASDRALESDPDADALVEESRARAETGLAGRDRVVSLALAAALLVTGGALAAFAPWNRPLDVLPALLLVAIFAVVSRVEFEVGAGSAVPTVLVLVPMLFVLPAPLVPLAVAAGYVIGGVADLATRRIHAERTVVLVLCAWHAVGPAALFTAAGVDAPDWRLWPLFAAGLVLQFACDAASAAIRDSLALGVPARALAGALSWVYLVDAMLAPIGLLSAVAAAQTAWALLLPLPLVGLLALFARERTVRIDHALELGNAYRGTAFLLGDVVEADDAYTGSHSRGVVWLVLQVADALGLDARERRLAEFTALLHDVGKIRIPNEIINKPGPLTPEEREIINTHTIEGEKLLEGVGGVLREVGRIVRSCHEHVDGGGYPDRLAGEQIPLVARIVCACDAFSAMTTTRSYRAARSVPEALEEMRRHAGTQFDARVVEVLCELAAGWDDVPEITEIDLRPAA